ncbi:MAG: hypothetical protein AAGK78_01675, partial [Planctomycetota bacterium]
SMSSHGVSATAPCKPPGLIYKDTFLDGSVRIPLIVSVPGGLQGAVAETPCELIDVGPTLCDVAGVELGYQQFGRSLLPATRNAATQVRDYAVSEFDGELLLATPQRKLMLTRDDETYAVIDRENDLDEQNPHASGEAELRDAVTQFRSQTQLAEPREVQARPEDLLKDEPR